MAGDGLFDDCDQDSTTRDNHDVLRAALEYQRRQLGRHVTVPHPNPLELARGDLGEATVTLKVSRKQLDLLHWALTRAINDL